MVEQGPLWFDEKDEQDTILVLLGETIYPFKDEVTVVARGTDDYHMTPSDVFGYSPTLILPELNATGIVSLVHDIRSLKTPTSREIGKAQAVAVPSIAIPTLTISDPGNVEGGLTCFLERYGEKVYAQAFLSQDQPSRELRFDRWKNVYAKDVPPLELTDENDLLQTGMTFMRTPDFLRGVRHYPRS